MILIVGGAFQAKLTYALGISGFDKTDVAQGSVCPVEKLCNYKIIDNFHLTIAKTYETGLDTDSLIDGLFSVGHTEIIIADEVGLGVVPVGEHERALRDFIGKTLAEIAKRVENVTRVSCGLGLRIK